MCSTIPMLPVFKCILASALAVCLAACGGVMDANSGGDHVRGKAKELQFGQTFDDHVSADEGDHTDWKSLVIEGDSTVTLDAWWDDPSVDAVIRIKDQFGGAVFELDHESGNRRDRFPGMKLREGQYYLEIVAKRGGSVYTLELFRGDQVINRPGTDSVAPPE